MRVIGAGFGRTGTSSLKEALDILGFGPTYHMDEVIDEPERVAQWRAAAAGEPIDWDTVFDGYESAVDWPVSAFWRELAARYPEAKVILTVRDPERWYASATGTVFRGPIRAERQPARAVFEVVRRLNPVFGDFTRMVDEAVHRRVFDSPLSDRRRVLAAYNRHIAQVQHEVPADRLLTYEVADGWAPLCAFLGVPVPDRPFPRNNDTRSKQHDQRRLVLRMLTASRGGH